MLADYHVMSPLLPPLTPGALCLQGTSNSRPPSGARRDKPTFWHDRGAAHFIQRERSIRSPRPDACCTIKARFRVQNELPLHSFPIVVDITFCVAVFRGQGTFLIKNLDLRYELIAKGISSSDAGMSVCQIVHLQKYYITSSTSKQN